MNDKVRYIEPNDIPFNNEDLCIGVKLEVEIPSRAIIGSHGDVNSGNRFVIGHVNLFEGEDGQLTTSYSDVSFLDVHYGGNKQSIGIESIHIKYNSWYYPEVTVKFIDLRGNAVMNPMENAMDKVGEPSFLNAIFTFPYPEFKLTVKGQYGKPVLYRLAVRDVRANLNAGTGNFEFNVSFIGYMYGFLTDIPMRYLMVAPYMQYSGADTSLGTFSGTNNNDAGKEIPTFIDFLSKLTNIMVEKEGNDSLTKINAEIKQFVDAKSKLESIKDAITRFDDDFLDYPKIREWYYKEYDAEKCEYTLTLKEEFKKDTNDIEREIERAKKLVKNAKTFKDDYKSLSEGSNYPKIDDIKFTDISLGDDLSFMKFVFNKKHDIDILKQGIDTFTNVINRKTDELNEIVKGINSSALGFAPTIGNIYQMIFAHMDKLHDNTHRCMQNIIANSNDRPLSNVKEETDVVSNGKDLTIPPFPLITDADKQYVWLEESTDNIIMNLDEKDLVNHTISASVNMADEVADVVSDFERTSQWIGFPKEGIPSLLSDLKSRDGKKNPYDGCNDAVTYSLDDTNKIPRVLRVLGIRMLLRYLYNTGKHVNVSAQQFGEIEALNFFNVIKDNDAAIEYILDSGKWEEELVTNFFITFYNNYLEGINTTKETHSIAFEDYGSWFSDKFDGKNKDAWGKCINGEQYSGVLLTDLVDYENTVSECTKWITSYAKSGDYSRVFPSPNGIPLNTDNMFYSNNNDRIQVKDKDLFALGQSGFITNFEEKDLPKKWTDNKAFNEFKDSKSYNIGKVKYEDFLNMSFKDVHGFFPSFENNRNGVKWFSLLNVGSFEETKFLLEKGNEDELIRYFLITLFNIRTQKNDFYFHGITKIPVITLLLIGNMDAIRAEILKEDKWAENWNKGQNLVKDFAKKYYDKNKATIAKGIKDIVIGTSEEWEYKLNGERCLINKLSEKGKKWLSNLFQTTVTIYHLAGAPNQIEKYEKGNTDIRNILNTYEGEDKDNTKSNASVVQSFVKQLQTLCTQRRNVETVVKKNMEADATPQKKLAVYMTYKELYDRWKFGVEEKSAIQYKNFKFVDSQYNDMSQDYLVNVDEFAKLIRNNIDGVSDMSIYSFMWEVCSMCNFTLTALPVNIYEAMNSDEKLKDIFTPYNYMTVENSAMETTYIAMYAHKDSEHLNISDPYNMYADDGLDFSKNDIVFKTDSKVPVFGVTYGLGAQRYFEIKSVGMDNPKVTAHSLMSELMISRQGANAGSQNIGFEGHDIFETYANKSYTCSVEMLGCAQMMPMMYFQLNNIPMFKGGYMITNVEHMISNGTMKTTFTGVRMNKNRFNITRDKLTINSSSVPSINMDPQQGETGKAEKVALYNSNPNNINFCKEETLILLDAGHDVETSGKQSVREIFQKIWGNDKSDSTGPDVTENGTMRPLIKDGNEFKEVYEPNNPTTTNKNTPSGSGRYREYWGNRKIVTRLYEMLRNAGYNVEIVSSNNGRESGGVENYSTKINNYYREKNGNCILISIHSNAVDGGDEKWKTANYWSIYCQSREYVEETNKWIDAQNKETSYALASAIAKNAKDVFVSRGVNVPVHTEPKRFESSPVGIRPTTYSLPATVLSENLFHTSKENVKFLGSKQGREIIAEIHFKGIEEFFSNMQKVPKKKDYVTDREEEVKENVDFNIQSMSKNSSFLWNGDSGTFN